MILNILDVIDYALYGNIHNTTNVLSIILDNQKNKNKNLIINDEVMNYSKNDDDAYLMISINKNLKILKRNDVIEFCYNKFKNHLKIILVRTNKDLYWDEWYENILSLYENHNIYVIYDFSDNNDKLSKDIKVIENSHFNVGIFLGYYYILKNNMEGKFLILDDKIILNSKIDENNINKSLFTFEHKWKIDEKYIYNLLNVIEADDNIILEFENYNWKGSFKSMSYVDSSFLKNINEKYKFQNLIKVIRNNQYEMAFERLLGLLFYLEQKNSDPIIGDIHEELNKINNPWNYTYDKYIVSKKNQYFNYIFK